MTDEKSNQSIVNLAFVLAGALGFYITSVLFETFASVSGAVAAARNNDSIRHGLPVAVGLIVFFVLIMNPRVRTWADECVTEVRKVVWPSRKDVTAMTIVCCVMCIVAGIGFGLFDLFASQVIKFFVNT